MSKDSIRRITEEIEKLNAGRVNLMEVCGTHTMSIAKSGLKSVLPENIKLVSGPGCPVCVTPAEVIDEILKLAENPDVIIATYGDMMRIPGSQKGRSLKNLFGGKCEIVYSGLDAAEIAKNTEKEVVFLGAGFETTAPGTGAAILAAKEAGLKNFSVLSLLKTTPPALRTLLADAENRIDGFICPGHVAVITGEDGFAFLPEEYGRPAVVSGFEPEDIITAVYMLVRQISRGEAKIENEYKRVVKKAGNAAAKACMSTVFEEAPALWRGLGVIPGSGLKIKEEYREYDAAEKFKVNLLPKVRKSACRCGEVLQGKLSPDECPLFGKRCTPEDPEGPCMVSGEGSCAALYRYLI